VLFLDINQKTMTTRKRIPKRKTDTAIKRRQTSTARKNNSASSASFLIPLIFIIGIVFCLGFLMFMGYRTVTASSFFDVRNVEMRGLERTSKEEIEKIVSRQSAKSGVWNADLKQIKDEVEKLRFVKTAVVSRVLPDGLRVSVNERVLRAIIRLGKTDYWADEDGVILAPAEKRDSNPPFVLRGWDETKSEKATKDNQERVKIYLKMLNDWKDFDLSKRVSAVNLADLQSPQAIVPDSGEMVTIHLPKDNFAKRLQKGLEIIVGRGREIESVNLNNQKEILGFRAR